MPMAMIESGGLLASVADEIYENLDDNPPLETAGRYRRIVLSRRNRYPGWDEMRDFIRTCGLFDRDRDVFMVLPKDSSYVNLHPHAFHWFQEIRKGAKA